MSPGKNSFCQPDKCVLTQDLGQMSGPLAALSLTLKASLMAQMVKNPPTMQETWVQFLGWEDPLGKGMATHSSILAGKIPWTEEPGSLQSMGSQRIRYD